MRNQKENSYYSLIEGCTQKRMGFNSKMNKFIYISIVYISKPEYHILNFLIFVSHSIYHKNQIFLNK